MKYAVVKELERIEASGYKEIPAASSRFDSSNIYSRRKDYGEEQH